MIYFLVGLLVVCIISDKLVEVLGVGLLDDEMVVIFFGIYIVLMMNGKVLLKDLVVYWLIMFFIL